MNIPDHLAQELKDWLFSDDGPYGNPKGVVDVWYTLPLCVTVDLDAHRVTRVTMLSSSHKIDYDREGGTVTQENGLKFRATELTWGVAIDIAELTDPEAAKHGWPIWEQE